jgi:peroxiredoxin Q/BCP
VEKPQLAAGEVELLERVQEGEPSRSQVRGYARPARGDWRTARLDLEVDVVREGEAAPDFTLRDDAGDEVTLSSFRGRPVILYFYPKDNTPGCTTQACELRDSYDEFRARGVEILGVSPDTEASHRRFRSKYKLPFRLLADPDHAVAERYGVWKHRSYMGRKYMGIERSTFVIDAEGNVARALRGIKPAGHAATVLAELEA